MPDIPMEKSLMNLCLHPDEVQKTLEEVSVTNSLPDASRSLHLPAKPNKVAPTTGNPQLLREPLPLQIVVSSWSANKLD